MSRLAMLLPVVALIAVVAISIVGRAASPPTPAIAVAVAVASERAASPVSATPSPRSDWPAAIGPHRAAGQPLPRQEGTDGLMGRLPFGLPDDTPTVRIETVSRFTIDDVRASWSGLDSTPPWVRRLGALSSYVTDPYER